MRTLSNFLTQTCRICGREDNAVYLDLLTQENHETKKMFNDLFPSIKIEKSNKMPTHVCHLCFTVMFDFYEIWKNSNSIQDLLNARVKKIFVSENDAKDDAAEIFDKLPANHACISTSRNTLAEKSTIPDVLRCRDGSQLASIVTPKNGSMAVKDLSNAPSNIVNKGHTDISCKSDLPNASVPSHQTPTSEIAIKKTYNRQSASGAVGSDSKKSNNRDRTDFALEANEKHIPNNKNSSTGLDNKTDHQNYKNILKTSMNNSGKSFDNDQQQSETTIKPKEGKTVNSEQPSSNSEKPVHQIHENISKASSSGLRKGYEEDQKQSGLIIASKNKEENRSTKPQSLPVPKVSVKEFKGTTQPMTIDESLKKRKVTAQNEFGLKEKKSSQKSGFRVKDKNTSTRTPSTLQNCEEKKSLCVAPKEKSNLSNQQPKIFPAPAVVSITSSIPAKENCTTQNDLWLEYSLPGKVAKLYQCRKCNAMLLKESSKNSHTCSSLPQISLKRCEQDEDHKINACDRILEAPSPNKRIKVRMNKEVSNLVEL